MKKIIWIIGWLGYCLFYGGQVMAGEVKVRNNEKKDYKAYLVSTAHFDTQWNWDVRESIDDYLHRTMVQNFWLFEHFPDYIFNFESAQKYAWMKEYYPYEYELVKKYIKAGRWNVSGSAWEAGDTNLPSGESFLRNILLGQNFYKKEFGIKANDIYLPDCFGFGYALPTIAAHCGLIGFSTQKLQWRKNPFFGEKEKMPFKIGLWQGLDGSRIMAVLDAGGYGTSYYYDDISTNNRILERAKGNSDHTAYSYYGVGDRGGSPTLPSVCSLEESLNADGPLEIISARSGQLYEDYSPFEKHPELPVYDGELLMDVHGVGCYTSQAAMKLFNRRNEHLADAAEKASVAAEVLGGLDYPLEALRENWQRFIWHQFHDDLTGTSIPQSYTFSWNDELIAQTRFAEAITVAVGAVSRGLDTKVKGQPVVVYNPVAFSRRDIVRATLKMNKRPVGIKVLSPKGESMPAQLLSYANGQAEILFAAQMDPLSFSTYSVQGTSGTTVSRHLSAKNSTVENTVYRVTLDAHGDIASIVDKRNNKELVDKPFRLMIFTENVSAEYPAWEIYKKVLDGPSASITDSVRLSVAENGPLRASLRIERTYKGSKFVQYVSLTDGAADDRIEIDNEVDWQGEKALLKAEFPTTVSNEKASYDLDLGYVERGNNTETAFEVPGRQWADLTDADASYGISVLNDSKYGWDKPDNRTIRLTLLHTPQTGKHYTYQAHQDHGHHTFRYAIMGHKSGVTQANVAWHAENFNQPLLAFSTPKHAGKLGRSYSFAVAGSPQIALKALKKSENGEGYIVRIHEIYGKSYERGSVEFASAIESAKEVNGLEEEIGAVEFVGNKLLFSGKAFQPRTFKVVFKRDAPLLTVTPCRPLELGYNALALTVDAFNRAGDFDRMGNSLAAELMPEKIVSDGIEFRMQNDPVRFNYIRANGDTILLPEHKGADKLFLLVNSVKEDRLATFRVDDKTYQVNVPYYTGFYGQWGWTGESEGYIRNAAIGYIANHKHSASKGNDSYSFAYLYKIRLDIPETARKLILPKDAGIAVFAATLTGNPNYDVKPLMEMRALPRQTKRTEYVTEPVPFYKEKGAW